MDYINFTALLNSILYSFIGFVMLTTGFYLYDKLTPWQLFKEIVEEQNIAIAIVVGAMALGISNIIAAAIGG